MSFMYDEILEGISSNEWRAALREDTPSTWYAATERLRWIIIALMWAGRESEEVDSLINDLALLLSVAANRASN